MKTLTIIIALFITTTSLGQAQDTGYSFKETYAVKAPAKISIATSDGNIEVVPSDANEVQVFYVVKKKNKLQEISREALEKEVNLNIEHSNNSLKIEAKHKDQNKWVQLGLNRLEVGFILHVPKESACNLRTSDGNVSLQGLSANQLIKTSDGNISITDVKGDVNGKTSDGNISLKNVAGNVEVRTSDGDIQLGKIAGNVQASTSDGNIHLAGVRGGVSLKTSDGNITFQELAGSLVASTSDGNIKGNIDRLEKELALKTSNGTIDVVIPDKLGLDLNVKGESLSIPLKNFSGRSDKHVIQGKMNGGGIAVNLSTSDGRVKLHFVE